MMREATKLNLSHEGREASGPRDAAGSSESCWRLMGMARDHVMLCTCKCDRYAVQLLLPTSTLKAFATSLYLLHCHSKLIQISAAQGTHAEPF